MSRLLWTILLGSSLMACRADEPAIPSAEVAGGGGDVVDASLSKPQLIETLPENVRTAITDCRTAGQFYDLRTLECGAAVFPSFQCSLDQPLRAAINSTAQQELDTFLASIDPDLRLYDCTLENNLIYVHFYKYEEERIKYSILKLAPR